MFQRLSCLFLSKLDDTLTCRYKASVAGKNLPDLIKISKGVGRYGAIYFEDYRSYLEMDYWNRDLLDKYCRLFKVKESKRDTAASRTVCLFRLASLLPSLMTHQVMKKATLYMTKQESLPL